MKAIRFDHYGEPVTGTCDRGATCSKTCGWGSKVRILGEPGQPI